LATAEAGDLPALRSRVTDAARALVAAQPSMAPMVNLANRVLWALEGTTTAMEARAAVMAALEAMERVAEAAPASMAGALLDSIRDLDQVAILTHSRSSLLLRMLLAAHRGGKRLSVICTESRPLREGRAMAQALAEAGVPVTLVVDAAGAAAVADADVVLVGADSVGADGLVNKMGTLGLALAAKAAGRPLYACCTTDKLLPAGYGRRIRIVEQDPQEVWESPPAGILVSNRYFDVTPLEHIGGLITERGLLDQAEVRRCIDRRRAHPALLEREA
jgi:translation initiation factor 2B subunit (eIF-2B alpha/beta/delta family)